MLDAALPNMISQPLRTRLTISTTAITGTETAEGEEKVISQLALTNEAIEARKAAAIVVITDELGTASEPIDTDQCCCAAACLPQPTPASFRI
jgi:hypothetical protein